MGIKKMKTKMPDTIYLFPTYYTISDTTKGDDGLKGCAESSKREDERKSRIYHGA